MKRNRMIVMIIAVMLVSMQFNIVTFASYDIFYDIYENSYEVINGINDNLVVQNFIDNGCFFNKGSGKGFSISSDTRDGINTILNYLLSEYKYVYIGCGENGGYCSFQIFCSNQLFYAFRLGIVVPNSTDLSNIKQYYLYCNDYGSASINSVNKTYLSDLQYWTSGNKGNNSSKTTTYNGSSYCILECNQSMSSMLYSSVPVYSEYEVYSIINSCDLGTDYYHFTSITSTSFISNMSNFWGKLTNVNVFSQGYDATDYEGAALDSTSEGSNNALSQFTMCGVVDERYYSNYGLNINYAMSDSSYNTYKSGKLVVDYTISLRLVEENSNHVYPVMSLTSSQKYSLSGQTGYINVDLFSLIKDCIGKYDSREEFAMYNKIVTALNGTSVDGVSISTNKNLSSLIHGNSTAESLFYSIGFDKLFDSISYTYNDVNYTYVFDTFTVTAKAYVSNGTSSTNRRSSSVNLVKGSNNSYNYTGNDVDNLLPDTSNVIDNTNYYVFNSDDNSYKYYNSVSNEYKNVGTEPYVSIGDIIVNVDVEGGGSSGSMVQNNNVSFPDNIIITIKGFLSGDNSNVTIEDDDLTDNSLREDLADGFGLIDDSSTPEAGDGYITLLSDTYSGIDPDFKDLIMFGISTTVGIAILRMIFKR